MEHDDHDCGDTGCKEKSKLAGELVCLVIERLDGSRLQDAVDVIGQVSAMLQATVYAKMKQSGVELSLLDGWREWRDNLVLDIEEDMARKKGSADGPG